MTECENISRQRSRHKTIICKPFHTRHETYKTIVTKPFHNSWSVSIFKKVRDKNMINVESKNADVINYYSYIFRNKEIRLLLGA